MATVDEFVVGETKPPLIIQWVDENQNPISLAGAGASARLTGDSEQLPDVNINVLGNIIDTANGIVKFDNIGSLVTLAQLATAGIDDATFVMEVKFTDGSGLWGMGERFYIKYRRPVLGEVAVLYNLARKKILDGTLSLSSDTLKFMLVKKDYQPDLAHTNVGQVSTQEVSGTGYTGGFGGGGRHTVTTKVFTSSDIARRGAMDCDDPSWSSISVGVIGYIVLIKEAGGNDAGSLPIAFIDVADYLTNGGTFSWTVPLEGLITY